MSSKYVCNQDVTLKHSIDPLISAVTIEKFPTTTIKALNVLPKGSEAFFVIGFNITGLTLTDGYVQAPAPVPGVLNGNSANLIVDSQSIVLEDVEVSVAVPVILAGTPPLTKNHTVKVVIDNPGQDKVSEI